MLILAALMLGLLICIGAFRWIDRYGDGTLPLFGALAFGFALFVAVMCLPLQRMSCMDELSQINAIRATQPQNAMQDAAWRMKAAEANAELASMKYWNGTAFDIWIPDEVESVRPLQ